MVWECQPLALGVYPDVGNAATGGMLRPIVRMTDTEQRDYARNVAAWEQPELFVREMRASFTSLR
jgi:hypothetical protein